MRAKIGDELIDELIADGLITSTTESYTHLPHDEWLLPTGCYNIWTDEKFTNALSYIRLYLGADDLGLGVKPITAMRSPEYMKQYAEWLETNEQGLEDLRNLEEVVLDPSNLKFSEEETEWICGREWYKNNSTVEKSLKDSIDAFGNYDELQEINGKLLRLYGSIPKYAEQAEKTKRNIELDKKHKAYRRRFNEWLATQEQTVQIQSVFPND